MGKRKRGRPATGRIRLAARVERSTYTRIMRLVGGMTNTSGKVLDSLFANPMGEFIDQHSPSPQPTIEAKPEPSQSVQISITEEPENMNAIQLQSFTVWRKPRNKPWSQLVTIMAESTSDARKKAHQQFGTFEILQAAPSGQDVNIKPNECARTAHGK